MSSNKCCTSKTKAGRACQQYRLTGSKTCRVHTTTPDPTAPSPPPITTPIVPDTPPPKYIKFMPENLTCRGFTYKLGVNEDVNLFNPSGSCKPGGLYFTTPEHAKDFFTYGPMVAEIELLPDSKVYVEECGTKMKADKFLVKSIKPNSFYPEICLDAVKHSWKALEFVKEQTREICLEAVKQNGLALEFVNKQTEDLCLTAVKYHWMVLKLVRSQTEDICLAAVKKNGMALRLVKEQTEEICLAAVRQTGLALYYVNYPSKDVCLAARRRRTL